MYLILCHLRPEFAYQPLVSFLAPLSPPSSPSFNIGITAAYAVGWAMMYGGAQLRLLCYRTLGRNFTYQLSVRKDHELVTSGPYKIVRHPSYTAAFTCFFGRTICMFGPGSWFIECGVGSTKWGKVLAGTWAVLGWIMSMLMLKRVGKEDEVLKETFKSKWEAWAKETPNVFIPYIY
ncbi:hypothetical protein K474DRAFT_926931 [Panus rudis PR-1116 ss-1]|nr:hypothetical protein K474DRAFT_926931 [Panus rudis PR-1116 ss-1]